MGLNLGLNLIGRLLKTYRRLRVAGFRLLRVQFLPGPTRVFKLPYLFNNYIYNHDTTTYTHACLQYYQCWWK